MSLKTIDSSIQVFISYSHTSEKHSAWVLELANRLMSEEGFYVHLDQWDLQPGQDLYKYMERCVTSPEIKKVIIILDKAYMDKANDRKGGVGTETQIITPSLYEDTDQNKFIPVIRERDANDNPFCPAFLKSRIFIDLSSEATFEENFEKLCRTLADKPSKKRPELGKLRNYDDEKPTFRTRYLVRGLDTILYNRPKEINIYLSEFLDELYTNLSSFEVVFKSRNELECGQQIIDSLTDCLPLRDDFLNFIDKLIRSGITYDYDLIHNFINNCLILFDIPKNSDQKHPHERDNFKFAIYELFLYLIGFSLKYSRFELISELLYAKYTSKERSRHIFRFPVFEQSDYIFEGYMNSSNERISYIADLVVERLSNLLKIEVLIEADLVCYYIGELHEITNESYWGRHKWFPNTYYLRPSTPIPFFQKLISKRYFELRKEVFNVKNVDEFKSKLIAYEILNRNAARISISAAYQAVIPLHLLIPVEKIATER